MIVKGQDDSFVVDKVTTDELTKSENYQIVHPNFDNKDNHIRLKLSQGAGPDIRRYSVKADSAKGLKTYEYFRLNEIEAGSLDEIQGKAPLPQFKSELAWKLAHIVRQLFQS